MSFFSPGPDLHYLEIMWRSAHLAAREAESRDAHPALQQGHLQEDDPLHPWCFCQKPSDGKFMIM